MTLEEMFNFPRATRTREVDPEKSYFSQAKKEADHLVFTHLSLIFLLLFTLYPGPGHAGEPDRNLSTEILELARHGDAEAQFSLALMYDEGRHLPRDQAQAVYWLSKSAEQGLPGACLYLGMRFNFGNGVQQDKKRAAQLYKKAAVQGWAMAGYLLAMLLLEEKSKEQRIAGAAWLQLAGEQGYPPAGQKFREVEQTLTKKERLLLAERYEEVVATIATESAGKQK